MTRLEAIRDAVDTAYHTEHRLVRRNGVPAIRSRGRWVATMGGEGDQNDQCWPCPGADMQEWRGIRQLESLVQKCLTEPRYAHVKEIWIEGGFDGADSFSDLLEDIYEPWVGSWEVLVWSRKDGWSFDKDGTQHAFSSL